MGVPKFFRWISERYPCLSELVREYQIPTFDNLYLDMNGIIHTCSHPNDFDPHFRISEDKIFRDIFHYIEVLFRMIQPQNLFFMAVDGVAPRAKMNQQRGRRFRSAKEAEVLEKKAQERGETLPSEARFDSNCITPGTVFMAKLHEQLKYFVTYKISQDPMWQKCTIILSGQETPGEGEHKIMDYIRFLKSQPDYDPNTRHCLYGLDADLIMLGMCTHEAHFSLLREEVKFVRAKQKRTTTPEEQTFFLLHLSLLREYLELEFQPLKNNLKFNFDIEKVIDDWVLMGFLVGNDFIPPLPDLHITEGALPILYQVYIEVLPTLGGYINENGTLNLERFQKYMEKLSAFDLDQFKETYADLKYFEGKTGRKLGSKKRKSYKYKEVSEEQQGTSSLREERVSQLIDFPAPTKSENVDVLGQMDSHGDQEESSEKVERNSPVVEVNVDLVEVDAISPVGERNISPDVASRAAENVDDDCTPQALLTNREEVPAESSKRKVVQNAELAALIKKTKDDLLLGESSSSEVEDDDDDDDDDDEDEDDDFDFDYCNEQEEGYSEDFHSEFRQHKRQYYMNKLEYSRVTEEVLRSQAEVYVRAIQWNLNYYYNGVCSWSWFYPHHYAPYISDVKNFSDFKLEFDMGEPFLPFQQLLAVLPAASKNLLPEPYQTLMVNGDSPIINYYPTQFKTDLNGKKQEWEAVVLIPFIDEIVLLDAMAPLYEVLTEEEKCRNTHGPALTYNFAEEDLGPYAAPEYFPSITNHHAKVVELWRRDIFIEKDKLVRGPCEGARFDVYFPGFPTFKHLPYRGSLEKRKVKVFEMASRGDNMIVEVLNNPKKAVKEVAEELLGNTIYVEWPHLIEARVVSVSSKELRFSLPADTKEDNSKKANMIEEDVKGNLCAMWVTQRNGIKERCITRHGIEIGNTEILVHCTPIVGRKYVFASGGRITLEKQWDKHVTAYALQATVKDITVHDPSFTQFKTVDEVFPPKTVIFLLGNPHYGSRGEVMKSETTNSRGRVKVVVTVTQEPMLENIKQKHKNTRVNYMTGSSASHKLGITGHLFSRISGTIYITKKETFEERESKLNVGLNLKFNKKNEEIPGYTKKENGVWLYSYKAVDLVAEYMKNFPYLFAYLKNHTGDDIFNEDDIFPEEPEMATDIAEWLKEQPHTKVERQKCGAIMLEPDLVEEIEQAVDAFYHAEKQSVKTVSMQVKPYLLFKSSLQTGSVPPDPAALNNLFDRIVSVRENYTVPLGLKGTIIGVRRGNKDADTLFDVVFDKPFTGGMAMNCSANRGYRLPSNAFINISHGQRTDQPKNPPTSQPSGNIPFQSNGLYSMFNSWNKVQPPQEQMMQNPQNIVMSHPKSAFASWHSKGAAPSPNQQGVPPPMNAQVGAKGSPSWRQKPQQPPQPQILQRQQSLPKQGQRPYIPPQQRSQMQPAQQMQQPSAVHLQPQPSQSGPGRSPQKLANQNAFFSKSTSPSKLLWNEVPGSGKMDAPKNIPPPFPSTSRYEVNDSGTEILKKMLRIPEDSTEKSKCTPPQQIMKQLSVQEIFEHARASEAKNSPSAETSNIMKLLKMFQVEGMGLPRYSYTENKEDNTVTAQVFLPNMRSFSGASASSREQASENAAKAALSHIAVDRSSLHSAPVSGLAQPLSTTLPSPPQQWCWQNNQQMGPNRFHIPQEFQANKQDWRVRNDGIRPFMNQWMHQQPTPQMPMSQQHVAPFLMQQQPQHQMRTPPRTNWREEPRQGSQFVPLQAVKQQRSKSGPQQQQQQQRQAPHQTSQMQQLQQLQQQLQQQLPQHLQLQPQRNMHSQQQQQQKQQQSPRQQVRVKQQSQETPVKPVQSSSNSSSQSTKQSAVDSSKSPSTSSAEVSSNAGPGRATNKATKAARQKKSRLAANFAGMSVQDGS